MNVTNFSNEDFDKPLVNRVANSGLITIDLEKYYPKSEILEVDLKDFLFRELLLKEKDFREHMANFDWSTFEGRHVAVHCSTDALIQQWAFMLIAKALQPFAASVHLGNRERALVDIYMSQIRNLEVEEYRDQRVMVKGCSGKQVPNEAYLEISKKLLPVVKSLMYGEACSNVPIYKKPK